MQLLGSMVEYLLFKETADLSSPLYSVRARFPPFISLAFGVATIFFILAILTGVWW